MLGISRYLQDDHGVSELLATADHAMYAAKAEGGGGFRSAWLPTVQVGAAETPRGPRAQNTAWSPRSSLTSPRTRRA